MPLVYIQNTGKDGGQVFFDKDDYMRFVFCLAYLNTDISVGKAGNTRHIIKKGYRGFTPAPKDNQLVRIIAFCLVPSGFHLVLEERKERGVSKFMQKLGTGYSVYINKKLGKTGKIFSGTYKTSVIQNDEEMRKTIEKIHRLPLGEIRVGSQPDNAKPDAEMSEEQRGLLDNYPWSSYLDHSGKRRLALLDF